MGTRNTIKWTSTSGTDHPHAYGDKDRTSPIEVMKKGSSPRVWGQAV